MRRRRRLKIEGPFSPRMFEMLASPAYRALSLSGHRVLSRIEVEYGNHGGNDNGRLPVTYTDFQKYGIDRKSIAGAVREVAALGFVRITERGRPSKSDFGRHPNYFELTYIHGAHGEEPTHEWRRHKAVGEALKIAHHARGAKDADAVANSIKWASKNSDAREGISLKAGPESPPENGSDRGGIPPLQSQAPKTGVLSISSRG